MYAHVHLCVCVCTGGNRGRPLPTVLGERVQGLHLTTSQTDLGWAQDGLVFSGIQGCLRLHYSGVRYRQRTVTKPF